MGVNNVRGTEMHVPGTHQTPEKFIQAVRKTLL
jgi:hypothetical protein